MTAKFKKNNQKILILGLPATGTTITLCFMQNIKNGFCMVEPHGQGIRLNDVNAIRHALPYEGDDATKILDMYDKSNIKGIEDIVPNFVISTLEKTHYNFSCLKETYYPETNPKFAYFCPTLMDLVDINIIVWRNPDYIRKRGILVDKKLELYKKLGSFGDIFNVRHLIYERFCIDPQGEMNRVLSGICKISGYSGKLKPYSAGSYGYRKAVGSDIIKKPDNIILTKEERELYPHCLADEIYEEKLKEAENFKI